MTTPRPNVWFKIQKPYKKQMAKLTQIKLYIWIL